MTEIYPDAEAVARVAAELFVACACAALEERGRFAVALAGGTTPRRMYELLATPAFSSRVAWEHGHFFWGDERCVPPDDPHSNELMVRRALLDHVPVPEDHIYPIRCHEDPVRAAAAYATVLRNFFAREEKSFDLALLGLGADGHTASIFPGTEAVTERTRWVLAVQPAGSETLRVTLTPPILNRARAVVFMVTGAGKGAALRDVASSPAGLIAPEGGAIWVIDRATAAEV